MLTVSTLETSRVTVIVSSTVPSDSVEFTVAVNPVGSCRFSSRVVWKPGSEKVIVYVPGRSSMMR